MSHSTSSRLDSRLSLCADFVREGARLADIGTDHAFLPIWLCKTGKCPCAIASDINPEPLKRGLEAISSSGLCDRITARLSDGLSEISADETDDIVIAGMGGELIVKILSQSLLSKDSTKHFILQPMTRSEVLLEWLNGNGFEILKQDCCVAAGKCYTVLLASYTGKAGVQDRLFPYIGKLEPEKKALHRRFTEGKIKDLKNKARGSSEFSETAKLLEENLNDRCK